MTFSTLAVGKWGVLGASSTACYVLIGLEELIKPRPTLARDLALLGLNFLDWIALAIQLEDTTGSRPAEWGHRAAAGTRCTETP